MDPQGLPTSQGQPAQTQSAPAPAADDWAEAEAAYNAEPSFEGLPNLVATGVVDSKPEQGTEGAAEQPGDQQAKTSEETKPEDKAGDAPESFEGVNLWSTEGLQTPDQFQSHLKKVQAYVTKQNQAKATELKEWKDGYSSVMQLVGTVAQNPERLPEILRANAKSLAELGIQINPNAFNQPQAQPQPKQPDPQAEKLAFRQSIAKALVEAQDETQLAERISDLFLQQEERYNQRLEEARQGVLREVGDGLKPIFSERQQTATVNMFNDAINSLHGEGLKDITEHQEAILNHIKEDPMLHNWLRALVKNPQNAAAVGVTANSIIKAAYQRVTEPLRIKQAEERAKEHWRSKQEHVGEKPGAYQQTMKSEGEDWDDIEKDLGSVFVYS